MSDRRLLEPRLALAQMSADIGFNLRQAEKRILSPGSSADDFTAGAQLLNVQNIADPGAPFTTIAEFDLLPGTWFLCAATSIDSGASSPGTGGSTTMDVVVQIAIDGAAVVAADYTSPWWFNGANIRAGVNLSPTARVSLPGASTVTLRARVSSDGGPHPASRALRSRLVAVPY